MASLFFFYFFVIVGILGGLLFGRGELIVQQNLDVRNSKVHEKFNKTPRDLFLVNVPSHVDQFYLQFQL